MSVASFIIDWNSEKCVALWTSIFDYSGALDFAVALVLLLVLIKRLQGPLERKLQMLCGILAAIAGICWVIDGKLTHRLSFLQSIGWRITDEQKAGFAQYLKYAPKGNVRVDWCMNEGQESADMVNRIIDMLNAAGYTTDDSHSILTMSPDPPRGVLICVVAPQNRPPFADAIMAAFNAVNFPVRGQGGGGILGLGTNEVEIIVGNKP
jgi:hypothetical protein